MRSAGGRGAEAGIIADRNRLREMHLLPLASGIGDGTDCQRYDGQ
jgi:hypothetical protein